MRWDAVIRDADGRWADGGTGVTTLVDLRSDAQTFGQFNEHFQTSDTGVPHQICSRSSAKAGG